MTLRHQGTLSCRVNGYVQEERSLNLANAFMLGRVSNCVCTIGKSVGVTDVDLGDPQCQRVVSMGHKAVSVVLQCIITQDLPLRHGGCILS